MADSKLEIIITAKDNASAVFSQTGKALTNLGQQGQSAGTALGSLAGDALKVATVVGGGLVAGLGAAVSKAADFEAGMSAVQAATGATAGEMTQLGAAAVALGADTDLAGISATDAAVAMAELGKGGVSVADQLGGATKGALLLASAGAISVGEASAIATKAMNIFGLAGTDVAHVADLMSAGANKSATDVGQLGAAFNQSAAVAKNAGLGIEELTGTLAFLAQRGMEGSDAGTSLKTAILALQAPTDKAAATMDELGINVRDANGEMLPFADIADVLKARLSGLSDAQRDAALKTIFGNDAIRVGIALYEGGGDAIRDWTAKVDDAGNAARTGATLNNNLKGSLSQLGAVFETAVIQVGSKFTPIVRTATDELSSLLTTIMESPEAQKALDDLGNKGAAALKALIDKVKDPAFQQQLKEWGQAALDVGTAIATLGKTVANDLGPPLQAALSWFSGLDEGGKQNVVTFGLVAAAALKYHDELGTLLSIIPSVIKAFAEKAAAKKALTAANEALAGSAGKTATAMSGTGAAATAAGLAIADAAVVLGATTAVTVAGVTAISAYNDATGRTTEQFAAFNVAQDAAAFAIAHGATETNGAVEGFIRYIDMTSTAITSTGDLANAWNAYINNISIAGQNTQMFTLAIGALGAPIADTTAGLVGLTDGLGNVAARSAPMGTALAAAGVAMVGATHDAERLADSGLVGLTDGFGNVTAAAGKTTGALNTTTATLNATGLATGAAAVIMGGYEGALASATKAIGVLNSSNSQLSTWQQNLQQQWNELDVAVTQQGYTTDEQTRKYQALLGPLTFLNQSLADNADKTDVTTLAAVNAYQQREIYTSGVNAATAAHTANTGAVAAATAALQAQQTQTASTTTATSLLNASVAGSTAGMHLAQAASAALTGGIDDTATAADAARVQATIYTSALKAIPPAAATEVTTPGLAGATSAVNSFTGAVNSIPSGHTTTITTVYETIGAPPGRAVGGPVQAQRSYIVGERGPELFVPSVSGKIVPSVPALAGRGGGSGGGGGGAVVQNFYISGNTLLSKDTATQQLVAGIVTSAQRRTIGYSV